MNNWWQSGVVDKVCPEPNSYVIRLRDGRSFRRTRSAINLDQSTSAGFGAVLPSAGPNPHAAVTAAQPHGNARVLEPTPRSSAAIAVGTSSVTPGRSFSTVVSGTPVSSPVPAQRAVTNLQMAPRRLDPCFKAPAGGPLPDQPSGSTRSGNTYLKQ